MAWWYILCFTWHVPCKTAAPYHKVNIVEKKVCTIRCKKMTSLQSVENCELLYAYPTSALGLDHSELFENRCARPHQLWTQRPRSACRLPLLNYSESLSVNCITMPFLLLLKGPSLHIQLPMKALIVPLHHKTVALVIFPFYRSFGYLTCFLCQLPVHTIRLSFQLCHSFWTYYCVITFRALWWTLMCHSWSLSPAILFGFCFVLLFVLLCILPTEIYTCRFSSSQKEYYVPAKNLKET